MKTFPLLKNYLYKMGFDKVIEREGDEATPKAGQMVTIQWTGYGKNGEMDLARTIDNGQILSFSKKGKKSRLGMKISSP